MFKKIQQLVREYFGYPRKWSVPAKKYQPVSWPLRVPNQFRSVCYDG